MAKWLAAGLLMLGGCASHPPLPTVREVDLQRFMGDWYVIAHIPAWIEKNASDAVESYALNADGSIDTTYRYLDDGKPRVWHPRGFVVPGTGNAVWGMQFIWPIKAEYRIAWLDADYQTTIIARSARDYAWIMARSPHLDSAHYQALVARLADLGYDTRTLRRVPQSTRP